MRKGYIKFPSLVDWVVPLLTENYSLNLNEKQEIENERQNKSNRSNLGIEPKS